MRAIVISSPDHPVEVLEIPEPMPEVQLEILAQRLDAAGVEFQVLPVSRNTSVEELTNDVERFVDSTEEPDQDPDDR